MPRPANPARPRPAPAARRAALALLALTATVAGLALTACGSGQAGPPLALPRSAAALPASRSSHVVVVVMENKEQGDVLGSPQAPYVTRLARRYASATAAYAIRHPSLPNYLALTGGSTFGIASDCTDCAVRAPNLVDQLEGAHRSWKAYMQGLPSPCYPGARAGTYAKKHDPFLYYRDVAERPARCRRVVPFGQLAGDLRHGRLPDFTWISPDLCADTHDCDVATGDRFLARLVPALLRELGPRGMLVLTWDEGTSDRGCCRVASGGRIPLVVAGPTVRRGARLTRPLDHYGVLRSVEDALGLEHLGGAACPCAGSLARAFRRAPRVDARPLARSSAP